MTIEKICRDSGFEVISLSGCGAFGHRFICKKEVRGQFLCDGFDIVRCNICGQYAIESCSLLTPLSHHWINTSARGYVISFGAKIRQIERATLEEEAMPYFCSWCKIIAANAKEAQRINNSRAKLAYLNAKHFTI